MMMMRLPMMHVKIGVKWWWCGDEDYDKPLHRKVQHRQNKYIWESSWIYSTRFPNIGSQDTDPNCKTHDKKFWYWWQNTEDENGELTMGNSMQPKYVAVLSGDPMLLHMVAPVVDQSRHLIMIIMKTTLVMTMMIMMLFPAGYQTIIMMIIEPQTTVQPRSAWSQRATLETCYLWDIGSEW